MTMTPEQAIAIWGTYEGLAAVALGLLLGFIAAMLLCKRRHGGIRPEAAEPPTAEPDPVAKLPIGELTRVDAKNGVVSMTINTQGLKAGNKVRLMLVGIALLLVGCSAFQSGPAQQAVQAVDAACALGLVHSPALLGLLEQHGLSPDAATWSADRLCSIPEMVDAFEQAKMARSVDPGASVIAEARGRGLL